MTEKAQEKALGVIGLRALPYTVTRRLMWKLAVLMPVIYVLAQLLTKEDVKSVSREYNQEILGNSFMLVESREINFSDHINYTEWAVDYTFLHPDPSTHNHTVNRIEVILLTESVYTQMKSFPRRDLDGKPFCCSNNLDDSNSVCHLTDTLLPGVHEMGLKPQNPIIDSDGVVRLKKKLTLESSGMFYLVISYCNTIGGSIEVSGTSVWENPHVYVPAETPMAWKIQPRLIFSYCAVFVFWLGGLLWKPHLYVPKLHTPLFLLMCIGLLNACIKYWIVQAITGYSSSTLGLEGISTILTILQHSTELYLILKYTCDESSPILLMFKFDNFFGLSKFYFGVSIAAALLEVHFEGLGINGFNVGHLIGTFVDMLVVMIIFHEHRHPKRSHEQLRIPIYYVRTIVLFYFIVQVLILHILVILKMFEGTSFQIRREDHVNFFWSSASLVKLCFLAILR